MAQCDGSNILNWQVYHTCIHIKIKSPPAILHQRGVCVYGGGRGTMLPYQLPPHRRTPPKCREKKKTTTQNNDEKNKTSRFCKRIDDKPPRKKELCVLPETVLAMLLLRRSERVLQELRVLQCCGEGAGLSWRGLQPSTGRRAGGQEKQGH